jgi:hypothetical protein
MSTARQQANDLLALLRRERDALADFLVALAHFDHERRWEELDHASLFAFLVKDLGLSNGAAAYRRAAVELVQRFPEVLEPIRDGRLCITTVFELSKVITGENASEVLPRFFGTSRRDAKNVVAELAPEPAPTRTVVTAAAPAALPLAAPTGRLADQVRANSEPAPRQGPDDRCNRVPAPTVVEPKTAELSRVHLTVPRRLLEKLAAARDALSHSHPRAGDAEILEAGLDLIIERHRKRRGIGCKPRKAAEKPAAPAASAASAAPAASPDSCVSPPPPRSKRSRHVPAPVWRAVWERDGGRCVWPLESGGVCGSTRRVELDHVDGFALGAGTTAEECRLLCRPHQVVSARRLYGDDLMDRYLGPKGGSCSESVAGYGPAGVDVATAIAVDLGVDVDVGVESSRSCGERGAGEGDGGGAAEGCEPSLPHAASTARHAAIAVARRDTATPCENVGPGSAAGEAPEGGWRLAGAGGGRKDEVDDAAGVDEKPGINGRDTCRSHAMQVPRPNREPLKVRASGTRSRWCKKICSREPARRPALSSAQHHRRPQSIAAAGRLRAPAG